MKKKKEQKILLCIQQKDVLIKHSLFRLIEQIIIFAIVQCELAEQHVSVAVIVIQEAKPQGFEGSSGHNAVNCILTRNHIPFEHISVLLLNSM